MPNHFHLLLTPFSEDGIGKLMQYVGRYYVQYFNGCYERTGTLWEGRYRATLLDPTVYLIPVSRYVETNPVRAGLVDDPGRLCLVQLCGQRDRGRRPPGDATPRLRAAGTHAKARQAAYLKGFDTPLDAALITRIRDATNKAWVLGDADFCHRIEEQLNRRSLPRPRGGDRRSAAYRLATGRA